MKLYLALAAAEQQAGRLWSSKARARQRLGDPDAAAMYQRFAAIHYRNARVYMGYADE
jgi:hypothetical protein